MKTTLDLKLELFQSEQKNLLKVRFSETFNSMLMVVTFPEHKMHTNEEFREKMNKLVEYIKTNFAGITKVYLCDVEYPRRTELYIVYDE